MPTVSNTSYTGRRSLVDSPCGVSGNKIRPPSWPNSIQFNSGWAKQNPQIMRNESRWWNSVQEIRKKKKWFHGKFFWEGGGVLLIPIYPFWLSDSQFPYWGSPMWGKFPRNFYFLLRPLFGCEKENIFQVEGVLLITVAGFGILGSVCSFVVLSSQVWTKTLPFNIWILVCQCQFDISHSRWKCIVLLFFITSFM